MLLFVRISDGEKVVIPLERVFDIWASEKGVININYDGGNFLEIEGTFQKKVETVKTVFSNAEDVKEVMRDFYKACYLGAKVFYFGIKKGDTI